MSTLVPTRTREVERRQRAEPRQRGRRMPAGRAGRAGSDPRPRRCRGRGARPRRRTRAAARVRTARRMPCNRGAVGGKRGRRHRLVPMVARSHGGWLALVPVKALPRGKSRLAEVLDVDARADLVLFLMRRVVEACLEAGLDGLRRLAGRRRARGGARASAPACSTTAGATSPPASRSRSSSTPRRPASWCSRPISRTSRPTTCAS